METDLDDLNILKELFNPLLIENNSKITEPVLQILIYLLRNTKYPKKALLPFVLESREEL